VISEDYSKIECYDRIKSIMDLNARTQMCVVLYSKESYNRSDVALLRLPPMIKALLEATKLHVSTKSGHWKL
jgi:hypothetical protein